MIAGQKTLIHRNGGQMLTLNTRVVIKNIPPLERLCITPERVANLCRSIKDEHDPKKFAPLIGELIRVLDEERH